LALRLQPNDPQEPQRLREDLPYPNEKLRLPAQGPNGSREQEEPAGRLEEKELRKSKKPF
jgi:hypothetical protein